MKGQNVLFSHLNDEWETPGPFFKKLDNEFHFGGDVAAVEQNAKCEYFYYKDTDALKRDWFQISFCNPPYSMISGFIRKAWEESETGKTVVCLIPARTDTNYWHEYVMKAYEIRFVRGRLKFKNPFKPNSTSATFPSAVVIFDGPQDFGQPRMRAMDRD
jgi:phage N-6-adenine-methyltransferase